MSFPARVWVDDQCDVCGRHECTGVSYGYQLPVICETCLGLAALAILGHGPPIQSRGQLASLRRRDLLAADRYEWMTAPNGLAHAFVKASADSVAWHTTLCGLWRAALMWKPLFSEDEACAECELKAYGSQGSMPRPDTSG